jgi:hypothetical protein
MPLTAHDARILGERFRHAGNTIDSYLDENWRYISRPEYETLSECQRTVLRVASFMTTVAVGLSIDQMANPALELEAVVNDARGKLRSLNNARDAILVAARLADLATGIMAQNAGSVFNAARDLRELLGRT